MLGVKLKNFKDAFRALGWVFVNESHFKIHVAAAVFAWSFFYWKGASPLWFALLSVMIALVWSAEIFNTAIEKLCDLVEPRRSFDIALIKELSSAAVLVLALFSLLLFACFLAEIRFF